MEDTIKITVQATIAAPIEKVWETYTNPAHVVKWNHASDDWHSPKATNDLKVGGKFNYRMEAKDGSAGFDFNGTYTAVKTNELIEYAIEGGRQVKVTFEPNGTTTKVIVIFDAENTNSIELQQNGWQSILNNFKNHTETA